MRHLVTLSLGQRGEALYKKKKKSERTSCEVLWPLDECTGKGKKENSAAMHQMKSQWDRKWARYSSMSGLSWLNLSLESKWKCIMAKKKRGDKCMHPSIPQSALLSHSYSEPVETLSATFAVFIRWNKFTFGLGEALGGWGGGCGEQGKLPVGSSDAPCITFFLRLHFPGVSVDRMVTFTSACVCYTDFRANSSTRTQRLARHVPWDPSGIVNEHNWLRQKHLNDDEQMASSTRPAWQCPSTCEGTKGETSEFILVNELAK